MSTEYIGIENIYRRLIIMYFEECNQMLAHAYIPQQKWTDETYDLERALIVGTIFPCLNQEICEYEWGETK